MRILNNMTTEEQRNFKVTFRGRKVWIPFHSAEKFMKKCRDKFRLEDSSEVRFLDRDDIEVDEDCFGMYDNKTEFKIEVDEAPSTHEEGHYRTHSEAAEDLGSSVGKTDHRLPKLEATKEHGVSAENIVEHPSTKSEAAKALSTENTEHHNKDLKSPEKVDVDAGKTDQHQIKLDAAEEFAVSGENRGNSDSETEVTTVDAGEASKYEKTKMKKLEGTRATHVPKEDNSKLQGRRDMQYGSEEFIDRKDEISWIKNYDVVDLKQYIAKNEGKPIDTFMQDSLEGYKQQKVNIAVIGQTGKGKSSLINALMYFKDTDEGAARVGEMETTILCQSFRNPKHNNIIYWDIPGHGTDKFPQNEKYLEKIKIDKYDFFILVSSERFPNGDLWLAKQLQTRGKRFYFVRSKVDIDMKSRIRRQGSQKDEKQIFAELKEDFETETEVAVNRQSELKLQKEVEVFLVSSHSPDKYEFDKLRERLVHDATVKKRAALIFGMEGLSKNLLDHKIEQFRSRMWQVAIISLFGKKDEQHPNMTILMEPLMNEIEFYREQLSLSKCMLGKIEVMVNTHTGSLIRVAEDIYPFETEIIESRLKKALEKGSENKWKGEDILVQILEMILWKVDKTHIKHVVRVLDDELISMKEAAEAVLHAISFDRQNVTI